ncbi:MAG TPA: hypothetical protein VFW97_05020 [Acidimicrobiia bacterium]|nr:hypothetical protein [Acidimicrobiia bacterium]
MSVVAVDWSGRRTGERRHLWTAEAHDGVLLRLEAGRTRAEVADDLIGRARDTPGVVVGFDFSFSLPAWFLRERGDRRARDLWDAATIDGEEWLRACEPPFWGRPGRGRPELAGHLRRTEAAVAAVGGIRPKSSFQVGGAGSVGTGSVRGFPVLARLQDAGYAIWPFDAPACAPVALEIWPRLFTGPVVKSDARARAAHLDVHHPALDRMMRDAAVGSEDAFDAAVSAVVMSRHEAELRALPALDDVDVHLEGCVWQPGVSGPAGRRADERPT